ncbi:MAG: hypothetical protein U0002_09730 [Thermoanaerobaculia bacterium]
MVRDRLGSIEPSFDPELEISPFALYRELQEGRPLWLVDLEPRRGRFTLQGAEPWRPGLAPRPGSTVFFGQAASGCRERVRRLRERGWEGARALYGGLALYRLAIDAQVVGEPTFLIPRRTAPESPPPRRSPPPRARNRPR